MISILDKFLEIAKAEIGVHETPGPTSTKRIIEYDATTTLKAQSDEIAWCSAFVNWVVTQTGIELGIDLHPTNSASARSWLNWGVEISGPIPGCIAVLKRGTNPALGHVGFVNKTTKTSIELIGGNQSDQVKLQGFMKIYVLSYRVPRE